MKLFSRRDAESQRKQTKLKLKGEIHLCVFAPLHEIILTQRRGVAEKTNKTEIKRGKLTLRLCVNY